MPASRPPRTGVLLLIVALGAGGAGYLFGLLQGGDAPALRDGGARAARPAPRADPWAEALGGLEPADAQWSADDADTDRAPAPPGAADEVDGPGFAARVDMIRRLGAGERSRHLIVGLVAEAALRGGAMLPEIEAVLAEGWDVPFPAWDGRGPGYPSLRVALLAAAGATGDPRAAELVAEVARTTESPVELVFSAHVLESLERLDPDTAQRTLDSLAGRLTREERRAMASIVGRVVPAVARANPVYAEHFVTTQLRVSDGPRADPRLLAPALRGLPDDRARAIVLDSVVAPEVDARIKHMLGGRAAASGDTETLAGLRALMANRAVDPRLSATIARGAMSHGTFRGLEREARRALKQGDAGRVQGVLAEYERRLDEARRTVRTATEAGARLPRELAKRDALYLERLLALRARLTPRTGNR